MVRNILFVCTGNTCRSPMAAALLRQLLNERGGKFKNIRVSSAGLYAQPGAPASPEAVETMRGYGVDLSNHLARELAREELAAADLILTMTNAQKTRLSDFSRSDRTHVLRGTSGKTRPRRPGDVPGPFGQPLVVYQNAGVGRIWGVHRFAGLRSRSGGLTFRKGGENAIALGAGHAGFHLKRRSKYLQSSGYGAILAFFSTFGGLP